MIPLENPMWEKACQSRVSGMTMHDAYLDAGHPGGKRSTVSARAGHFFKKPEIKARMLELQLHLQNTTLEATGSSRESIMKGLEDNVRIAKAAQPVLDHMGNEIGQYKINLPAANKALELLGKEHGMFADRLILDNMDEKLDGMDAVGLRKYLLGILPDIGFRMIGMSPEEDYDYVMKAAARLGMKFTTMTREEQRDYCTRVAPLVGLRVEASGDDLYGAEDEEVGRIPALPQTAGNAQTGEDAPRTNVDGTEPMWENEKRSI